MVLHAGCGRRWACYTRSVSPLHKVLPPLEEFERWRDSLDLSRLVSRDGVLHVAAVHTLSLIHI